MKLSYEELQDLVENSAIGIHKLDLNGKIIYSNDTETKKILGFETDELIGRKISDFTTDDDETAKRIFEDLLETHKLIDHEAVWIAKDGTNKFISVNSNLQYDKLGNPTNTRCYVTDNTVKLMQKYKDDIARQIEIENIKQQDRFLRKIVHEIRTPLVSLFQTIQNDEESQQLGSIVDLLADIQDCFLFDTDKTIQVQSTTFSLLRMIKQLVTQYTEDHHRINIIFETNGSDRVNTDYKVIKRILKHLLKNAVAYSTPDSVIIVRSQYYDGIDVEVCSHGDKLDSKIVFESSQRYYNETDEFSCKGMGLGLYIVNSLLNALNSVLTYKYSESESMNIFSFQIKCPVFSTTELESFDDNINAERLRRSASNAPMQFISIDDSEVSEKTIKDFSTPYKTTVPENIRGKTACSKYNAERMHILIVDDNRICRAVLQKTVQHLNCTCELTEDGTYAIDTLAVNGNRFNLIILDIRMPLLNGIETCKKIRNFLKLSIPVIGFSADQSFAIRKQCMDAGMNNFIEKPATKLQIETILLTYKTDQ
jgi:PAS domain S-box-containing protein